MAADKREVLRGIEGDYLLDYAIFTGAVRVYVTRCLEERFLQDKNDLNRRMFLLAVYREEYSAYEDLGAMLDALLTSHRSPKVPLLERLISYGPGEVVVSRVMERFAVKSAQDLHDRLGLSELIPPTWSEQFSKLDLQKVLRTAADFFFMLLETVRFARQEQILACEPVPDSVDRAPRLALLRLRPARPGRCGSAGPRPWRATSTTRRPRRREGRRRARSISSASTTLPVRECLRGLLATDERV